MVRLRRGSAAFALAACLVAWSAGSAWSQEPAFLAVVRTDQPLVDARGKQLEKLGLGQLLTVMFTEEKRCLVQTTGGTKGWVGREEVVRRETTSA